MTKDVYKYDSRRVYDAQQAARVANRKLPSGVPPPPPRRHEYGKLLMREVGREKLPTATSRPERRQKDICPACHDLMIGSGKPIKIYENGKKWDELYNHLPRKAIIHNAAAGCSLCRLILQQLRLRVPDSEVVDEKNNFVGYDFGKFKGEETTHAVLFYEYAADRKFSVVLNLLSLASGDEDDVYISPSSIPSLDTTAAALFVARDWLEDCDCIEDGTCEQTSSQEPRFLPARLIDVGDDIKNEHIRLVTTGDVVDGSSYATLSHCWGDASAHEAYFLTHARVDKYRENIPKDVLPRTFLEACTLARSLYQKYLWIDSLCIIQDSQADWSRQSTQMGQIYRNSYINISATAAKDAGEGLFRRRPPGKALEPCVIQVGEEHPAIPAGSYRVYSEEHWKRGVDDGPLNSRAWVLQERLLAPRNLHYGEKEVFWECQCQKASETFPLGILPRVECQSPIALMNEPDEEAPSNVPYYSLLKAWSAIVEHYSRLHLTFPSDKLIALSALAEQISLTYSSSGKYLAGLWEAPLIGQLLWVSYESHKAQRAKLYRAPSWSWACIDGEVEANFDFSGYELYGDKSASRPMIRVLEATTVTNDGQLYGTVKSARLRVAGCLLKVDQLQEREEAPKRRRKTPEERKKSFIDMMAKVKPGYTGENLKMSVNIVPGTLSESVFGVDKENRMMYTGDSSWWDGDSYNPKVRVGDMSLPVTLDSEAELADLTHEHLFLLPVSCISENNRRYNRESYMIHRLGCLVLALAEKPDVEAVEARPAGRYRRVGMCELEDHSVPGFLCNLGNQKEEDIPHEGEYEDSLLLEDFVPKTWPYKDLDFIPQRFPMVRITLV